jgi:hypothetical protein
MKIMVNSSIGADFQGMENDGMFSYFSMLGDNFRLSDSNFVS